MDKIKTLEDFKEMVSKEHGFRKWSSYVIMQGKGFSILEEATTRYAEYCCQQQRIIDAENAKVLDQWGHFPMVDPDSILNAPLFVHQSK